MRRRLTAIFGLCVALVALGLVAPAAAPAQAQTLVWTADDSLTTYKSAPATATAGTATLVFENSEATGNTTGLSHTLTFDRSTEGYNHDVDVNITASPLDSNGGRHEVEVNLSPGKYRYFCSIPGHEKMVGELIVTSGGGEDTTPPEVTAEVTGDQDADGNYLGSASVALDATDTGSGVDTVEYQIDDHGYQPYTNPVTVDEVGQHTVTYRATDKAGNTSEVGSVTLTVVEGDPNDSAPPEVSAEVGGDTDGEGNYVGRATVTVNATDDGSGVDTVEFDLDDAGFAPYNGPVEVAAPGAHTMRFRATDHAGNVSQVGSVEFTVVEVDDGDQDPPVVRATVQGSQDHRWNYVDLATVRLWANDEESGVRFLRYSLDGGSYTAYGEPIEITEPGEHTVLYHAVDHEGNRSEDGTMKFTLVAAPSDACLSSDVSDTVVIGNHDTTVRNVDAGDGCTIADLVTRHGKGHGQHKAASYQDHVKRVADTLVKDGVISGAERSRLLTAAA